MDCTKHTVHKIAIHQKGVIIGLYGGEQNEGSI